MSASTFAAPATPPVAEGHPRRWLALAVLALAQLMVVLDATIVNIALPNAQAALHITDANRQWMVTAYTLTFGGLLLLGGRIADYWGRKRTFIVGAIGFALASAVGGLAQNGETLFAARASQGAFGALLAPAGLALLTVMFVETKERAKAFAVYGAIAGGGAALGLLLGGVLTQYANWRWCLLVNIPVAVIAILAARAILVESRAQGSTKYDIPGALTVTAGLVSLVYGFTKAAGDGWSSAAALSFIGVGVVLLGVFVVIEMRTSHPLLPLRIPLHRSRGGAFLASTFVGAGLLGSFLFLTYYFQAVLLFSPLRSGLASLPVTAGVFVAAGAASALVPRLGAKPLMVAGTILAATGMFSMTGIGVDTSYATHVLPGLLVMGLGMGFAFVPLSSLALIGVPEGDAGAASATLNATQQVGASLGVALLNTFFTTAVTSYLTHHPATAPGPARAAQAHALVDGTVVAFRWGAGILLLAGLVSLLLIKTGKADRAAVPVG